MKPQLMELKKWIERQKEVSQKGYVHATDEEARTMYGSEDVAFGLVIMKIDKIISESNEGEERKFSLKEALEIWDESGNYHSIDGFIKDSPDKVQYFKQRFNIKLP